MCCIILSIIAIIDVENIRVLVRALISDKIIYFTVPEV